MESIKLANEIYDKQSYEILPLDKRRILNKVKK